MELAGAPRGENWASPLHFTFLFLYSCALLTAGIMFASNLILGLYIHYTSLPSHNSTMAIVNGTLVSPESLTAEPSGYITLIPLVATMLFIMGMNRSYNPYSSCRGVPRPGLTNLGRCDMSWGGSTLGQGLGQEGNVSREKQCLCGDPQRSGVLEPTA